MKNTNKKSISSIPVVRLTEYQKQYVETCIGQAVLDLQRCWDHLRMAERILEEYEVEIEVSHIAESAGDRFDNLKDWMRRELGVELQTKDEQEEQPNA